MRVFPFYIRFCKGEKFYHGRWFHYAGSGVIRNKKIRVSLISRPLNALRRRSTFARRIINHTEYLSELNWVGSKFPCSGFVLRYLWRFRYKELSFRRERSSGINRRMKERQSWTKRQTLTIYRNFAASLINSIIINSIINWVCEVLLYMCELLFFPLIFYNFIRLVFY